MTPHQILAVAVRMLAVIWFVYTLSTFAISFTMLGQLEPGSQARVGVWLVAAVQLAICGLLWLFPATVASKLLRSGTEPVNSEAIPPSEWQTMIVISLGLWVLVRAFPDVIYWLTIVLFGGPDSYAASSLMNENRANIIATIAEIGLGLWLMFGGAGFAAFLLRVRTAGLRK